MNTAKTIEHKVSEALAPYHLEVLNESDSHNVPANSETHFKLIIVSQEFEGQSLVNRHRTINQLLAEQLEGGVHALSLHTMTESEWQARHARENPVADSPDCLGGDGGASKKASHNRH